MRKKPDNSLPGWDKGIQPLNALGTFFVIFDVIWTLLVVCGLVWMWTNRRLASVRMRNVPLSTVSVIGLHGYGGFYILAYPLKGSVACAVEFWMMCGLLPLSIALFQATNIQLLSVATLQQRFLKQDEPQEIEQGAVPTRCPFYALKCRWKRQTWLKQTMVGTVIGMVFQVLLSLFLFLGSRKFHDSYGLWSHYENRLQCRQGFEWFPTIMWQVFWSWIFAPCVLYKIRNIQEVHYWRLQTSLCIVAGLIALPMWLGSLYSPWKDYRRMNIYWGPPLWFLPGIMMMEVATLFFPFYEVLIARRAHARAARTMEAIEETRRPSCSSKNNRDYSLAALERALTGDSSAFLRFAATHDFSGENIMFLNHVRDWKAAWEQSPANLLLHKPDSDEIDSYRRHLYNVGLEIYITYVHLFGAEFPVNIESGIYRELKTVFMPAAMTLMKQPKPSSQTASNTSMDIERPTGSSRGIRIWPLNRRDAKGKNLSPKKRTPAQEYEDILFRGHENIVNMVPRLPVDFPIPGTFNDSVYDNAANSVKMLILRNTWPKFVDYEASNRRREANRNLYTKWISYFRHWRSGRSREEVV
ncbi:hypothetical protein FQN55_003330 [Onygenales sp. PD_40]|nr:hypothetical protein FQN55_003330 [Onygenales sp. PD_40]